MGKKSAGPSKGLIGVRATLILLIALIAGLTAGVLTFVTGEDPAASFLSGVAAATAALMGAHTLIDDN